MLRLQQIDPHFTSPSSSSLSTFILLQSTVHQDLLQIASIKYLPQKFVVTLVLELAGQNERRLRETINA